jgi:hypothetical protein
MVGLYDDTSCVSGSEGEVNTEQDREREIIRQRLLDKKVGWWPVSVLGTVDNLSRSPKKMVN